MNSSKFHYEVEVLLRNLVFKSKPHYEFGIQSNVWWWTHSHDHDTTTAALTNPSEVVIIQQLVQYFSKIAGVSANKIAVVTPFAPQAAVIRSQIPDSASVDDNPDIVLISLCRTSHVGRLQAEVEPWLAQILPKTRSVVIFVSHDSWVSGEVAGWQELNEGVRKLRDAEFALSHASDGQDLFCGGRVSFSLPLCCPRHPFIRSVATTDNVKLSLQPFCPVPCLRRFHQCPTATHICQESCHLHSDTLICPYVCERVLPCQPHSCFMLCSEPCDCLNFSEAPMPCSHVVPWTNNEVVVNHTFIGSLCCRPDFPNGIQCLTSVPALCMHCLEEISVPCYTRTSKTSAPKDLECQTCATRRQQLRDMVYKEVLAIQEKSLQAEKEVLEKTKKVQYEASYKGVFLCGQMVYVAEPDQRASQEIATREWPELENSLWHDPDRDPPLRSMQPGTVKARCLNSTLMCMLCLVELRQEVGVTWAAFPSRALRLAQPLMRIPLDGDSNFEEPTLLITGPRSQEVDTTQLDVDQMVIVLDDACRGVESMFDCSLLGLQQLLFIEPCETLVVGALAIVKQFVKLDSGEYMHLIQFVDSGKMTALKGCYLKKTFQYGTPVQILSVEGRLMPSQSDSHTISTKFLGHAWSFAGIKVGDIAYVVNVFSSARDATSLYVAIALFPSSLHPSKLQEALVDAPVVVLPLSAVEVSREDEFKQRSAGTFVDKQQVEKSAWEQFSMEASVKRRKKTEWMTSSNSVAARASAMQKQSNVLTAQAQQEERRREVAPNRQKKLRMETTRCELERKSKELVSAQKEADHRDVKEWQKIQKDDESRRVAKRVKTGVALF